VTNNHVIEGADRVTVVTSEGKRLQAKVVGTDKKDDLAVVKLEGKPNLPPVPFGDSEKLQVGELVMAIGSPLGLQQTVTIGVVSAKGRRLDGTPYSWEDFVQTDAAINHGNSGGPLVNMNGEVVGVNSRIAGEGTGIGFSVSSNVARRVAQLLMKDGRVRRPYIGVSLDELTPEKAPFFKAQSGVLVGNVLPGSPASKAGIQEGDVITAVDGKTVTTSEQVVRAVQSHSVGQEVKLQILRNGSAKQLSMKAAEAPDEAGRTQLASGGGESQGKYGMRLEDLSPDDGEKLGVKTRKGAVIVDVEPGSSADEAGLSEGDVVVEVDRKPVTRAAEVISVLGKGGMHLLRVEMRGGGARFVTITAGQ
jgi:serine protease Do